jgi:hypothetical protein
MDLSSPFLGLFPTVDSAVLAVLAGATKPRTGREVARLAGRSQSGTQLVLDRLVEHGLVLQEDAGRSRIYRLNRKHLASQPIVDLVNLRASLIQNLNVTVSSWHPPPLHLSVFGSAARGDGDVDSDIDVFLVRPDGTIEDDPDWRRQVDRLVDFIYEWTGNHAGIAELSGQELGRVRHDRPLVIENIQAEAIDVYGTPVRELLGRR